MRSPRSWFLIALALLLPLQIFFVARNDWFTFPPKPTGDGPDYENIAYHVARGEGWSLDWTDLGWRAPYVKADARLKERAERDAASRASPQSYAVQLARSDGYTPTTGRPPLLPTLIAFVYWLVERGPIAFATVRILLASCLAVAGAISVAMAARIIGRMTNSTWPVVVATAATLAFAASDRTVRTYATDFLTEPLALLLLQLWLWCLCDLLGVFDDSVGRSVANASGNASALRRERALATLTGILLGLLIYTRSAIVLWLPALWLLLVIIGRWNPSSLRRPVVVATHVVLVSALVCLPWWLRNCAVLGAWMPLGTQGLITLVGGYSDQALAHQGEWQLEPEVQLRKRVEEEFVASEGSSLVRREVRVARAAGRQVRSWIGEHLTDLPRLAWMRLATEWNPYTGRALIWKLAALVGMGFLAVCNSRISCLLGGVLLINTLMVMVLYSVGGRFLVPTYGILYALAGIGTTSIFVLLLRPPLQLCTSCPQAAATSAPIE